MMIDTNFENGKVIVEIMEETVRIRSMHPEGFQGSVHKALGVLEEEFWEWKMEIFKRPIERDKDRMRREAVQVAANMILFIKELT